MPPPPKLSKVTQVQEKQSRQKGILTQGSSPFSPFKLQKVFSTTCQLKFSDQRGHGAPVPSCGVGEVRFPAHSVTRVVSTGGDYSAEHVTRVGSCSKLSCLRMREEEQSFERQPCKTQARASVR